MMKWLLILAAMLVTAGFGAALAEEGKTTAWAALQAKIDGATEAVSIVPEGQSFDFDTPINGDLTLTAAWDSPIVSYAEAAGMVHTVQAAGASQPVPYVNAAGMQAGYIADYTPVTSDVTQWNGNSGNGWHVVLEDVTLGSVTVYGDTNLLIRDHVTLTVNGGLYVKDGARLTIWAQSSGRDTMGKLIARGGESAAGIGGRDSASHGAIVFNGGYIVANGGDYGAGIGGGEDRGPSSITINSGYIEATGGKNGAGIGGGEDGGGGTVTINGGTVRATGGEHGAGIGGGSEQSAGAVIINGGDVLAKGKRGGAGIGSGYYGDFDGSVTINGGVVECWGDLDDGGAGIGAGFAGNATNGTVTISGGDIKACSDGNKGAGIGGGNENWAGVGGEGATVVITGGKVKAWTWSGLVWPVEEGFKGASAIGHGGSDSVSGRLTIGDGLKVSAGDGESFYCLYTTSEREDACHNCLSATIETCDHPNSTYVSVTGTTHTQATCPYCNRSFPEESHEWDEETLKCRICGYTYDGPTVTVSYAPNGGSGTMEPVEVLPDCIFVLPECGFTEPVGTTFSGWKVSGVMGSDGEPVTGPFPAGNAILLSGTDALLTAQWERAQYTVSFYTEDGSNGDAQTVPHGDNAVRPGDPAKQGCVFLGWQLDGQDYDFDTPVTDDITLRAVWEKPWPELQARIDSASEGETIVVTRDMTPTLGAGAITVPVGKNVTIDLNGHTIDRGMTDRANQGWVITVAGTLTLADSGTGGRITGGWSNGDCGGVKVTGTFIMNGGIITGNVADASAHTANGGGVCVDGGVFTMNDGVITENTSGSWGGGVYLSQTATMNLNGGAITNNTCGENGGGVHVSERSVINVSGHPEVNENRKGDGANNLRLSSGSVLHVTGPMRGASISVTMAQPGVFTDGLSDNGEAGCFLSDSPDYNISLNADGEAMLDPVVIPPYGTPDFTLPANITVIEEYAFEGADMTVVYIPDGCTEIGAYAFKDCRNLRQIRVPAGCAIGEFAFDGCENVTIFGVSIPGSGAEQYCANHDNCTFAEEAP